MLISALPVPVLRSPCHWWLVVGVRDERQEVDWVSNRGTKPLWMKVHGPSQLPSLPKGFCSHDGKSNLKGQSRAALGMFPPWRENAALQKSTAALCLTNSQSISVVTEGEATGKAFVLGAVLGSWEITAPGSGPRNKTGMWFFVCVCVCVSVNVNYIR